MSSYTPTRKNYYQNNKEEIKRKRKIRYQEKIEQEKASALVRHTLNKKRNNEKSLKYYYAHAPELNKKRTQRRIKTD